MQMPFKQEHRRRTSYTCLAGLIAFLILLPSSVLSQSTEDTFRGIPIRPENRCSPYNSEDYPYSQSVEPNISVHQGGFFSPYSMRCFVSIRQTDIEHIVARSEAHDSGLCAATAQVRKDFAKDLLNLTHAAPLLNRRQKIAYDASEWLPANNRCWYANTIVEVKRKYGLTVDEEEAAVLSRILQNCPNVGMEFPTCADEVPFSAGPIATNTLPMPPEEEYYRQIVCEDYPAANAPTVLGWVDADELVHEEDSVLSALAWSQLCEQ